jgi:hypothetical protein
LVQPADCDPVIVSLIVENRQRDSAMLLYFLVPWILVTLMWASPLPDMLRLDLSHLRAKLLELVGAGGQP